MSGKGNYSAPLTSWQVGSNLLCLCVRQTLGTVPIIVITCFPPTYTSFSLQQSSIWIHILENCCFQMAGESVFISDKIFYQKTYVDRPMGKVNKLVRAEDSEGVTGLATTHSSVLWILLCSSASSDSVMGEQQRSYVLCNRVVPPGCRDYLVGISPLALKKC